MTREACKDVLAFLTNTINDDRPNNRISRRREAHDPGPMIVYSFLFVLREERWEVPW